jgi:hypothetical protein
MVAEANWFRLMAVRCLEQAATLPADAPASEQLRLFAAEFAEMAAQLEFAGTAVLVKKPRADR